MNLKIWNSDPSQEYEPNQLFVKLIPNDSTDDILLVVVDKDGKEVECGHILSLDLYMKCLVISENLSDIVPLKTDVNGCALFITSRVYDEMRKDYAHRAMMSKIVKSFQQQEQENASKH